MAIGVAVYPQSRAANSSWNLPPPPDIAAPKVLDLEHWMQLEPAPEPALSFPSATEVWSATGEPLDPVEQELDRKAELEAQDTGLGLLAADVEISTATGCWTYLKGRDSKGYVRRYNALKYGIEQTKEERRHGIKLHRLAHILMQRHLGLDDSLSPDVQIDHICRGPWCCNPNHGRPVSNDENIHLRTLAHKVEVILASGQTMIGQIGTSWIDNLLSRATAEDTGVVVATRFGPHRLIKLDGTPTVAFAQREPDDLFDALHPPAVDRRIRKSRARRIGNVVGQQVFEFAA